MYEYAIVKIIIFSNFLNNLWESLPLSHIVIWIYQVIQHRVTYLATQNIIRQKTYPLSFRKCLLYA